MPVFICQKCFKPIGTEGMTELDGKIYHKRCAKSITPPQTERRERKAKVTLLEMYPRLLQLRGAEKLFPPRDIFEIRLVKPPVEGGG